MRLRRCRACGKRWTVKSSLIPAEERPSGDAPQHADGPTTTDSDHSSRADQMPIPAEEEAPFTDADRLLPQHGEESSRYEEEGEPEPW